MKLGLEGSVASPRHRFGPQSSPKGGKRPGAKGFRASFVRGVRDCFNPHSTSCLTSLPLFLAALVLSFTLVRFYDAVDQRIDAVHRLSLKEEELADVLATRAEARVAVLQARKRLVSGAPSQLCKSSTRSTVPPFKALQILRVAVCIDSYRMSCIPAGH